VTIASDREILDRKGKEKLPSQVLTPNQLVLGSLFKNAIRDSLKHISEILRSMLLETLEKIEDQQKEL
jgi:hypothetical protein